MDEFDQPSVGPGKGEPPFPVPGEPPRPLSRRQRTPRILAKKPVKGDPVVGIGMSYGSHLPLNHRAQPKFLPKRTTQRILKGLPRVAPSRREGPQSPQKPVGRTSHQEQRAVRAAEHRRHDIVMGKNFLRALRRDRILKPPEVRGTAGSQGTLRATRGIRQADDGAQVHHRECRVPTLSFPHQARGPFPKDVLHRGGTGIPFDGEKTGDDATGVRVEDRDVRIEGDRGDRTGRRSADPRERFERLHRARHLGAVAGDEVSRRPDGGSSRGNSTRVPPTPSGRRPAAPRQGIPHRGISGESVRSRERRFRPGSAGA